MPRYYYRSDPCYGPSPRYYGFWGRRHYCHSVYDEAVIRPTLLAPLESPMYPSIAYGIGYSPAYTTEQLSYVTTYQPSYGYSNQITLIEDSAPWTEPLQSRKRFYVSVPLNTAQGQSFPVLLDDVEYNVTCPQNCKGGNVIIVSIPREVQASVKYAVDSDRQPTFCNNCTYVNKAGSEKCQNCRFALDVVAAGGSLATKASGASKPKSTSKGWFKNFFATKSLKSKASP